MSSFKKRPLTLCLGLGITLSLLCSQEILAKEFRRPLTIEINGKQTTVTLVANQTPPEGAPEDTTHGDPDDQDEGATGAAAPSQDVGHWSFSFEFPEGVDPGTLAGILQQPAPITVEDAGSPAVHVSVGGAPPQTMTNLLQSSVGQLFFIPGLPAELFPPESIQVDDHGDGSLTLTHSTGLLTVTIEQEQFVNIIGTLPAIEDVVFTLGPIQQTPPNEVPLSEDGDESEDLASTKEGDAQEDEADRDNVVSPPTPFKEEKKVDGEVPQLVPADGPGTPMPTEGNAFNFGSANPPPSIQEEPEGDEARDLTEEARTKAQDPDRAKFLEEVREAAEAKKTSSEQDEDEVESDGVPDLVPAGDNVVPEEHGGDKETHKEGGVETYPVGEGGEPELPQEGNLDNAATPEGSAKPEAKDAEDKLTVEPPEPARKDEDSKDEWPSLGEAPTAGGQDKDASTKEDETVKGQETADEANDPPSSLVEALNPLDDALENERDEAEVSSGNDEPVGGEPVDGDRTTHNSQESHGDDEGITDTNERTGGPQAANLDFSLNQQQPLGAGTVSLKDQIHAAQVEFAREAGLGKHMFEEDNFGF